jgi:S1-C subfamily serine protease
MENNLGIFSDQLAAVVRAAEPYVVAVDARRRFSASGVVWRPGIVVTAEHAIRREDDIAVTLPGGDIAAAKLAGRDPGTDLAVLRVEGAAASRPEAGGAPDTGALVLAVGRSATTGVNATLGIISAVSGAWRTWRGGQIDRYIRLDLTLYAGLSGAAVIDVSGRVVGIATSALSRLAGVAIPASTVDAVTGELLARGRVARPYLGVGLQPVRIPEHLAKQTGLAQSAGLIVLSVEPGGPTDRAGVQVGDILAAVAGQAVEDTDAVQAALATHKPGHSVGVVLLRGGVPHQANITLGEFPRGAD